MINLPKLVLASGSPRRAEILTAVGWEFTKDVADIDESILPDETPEDYVKRLALQKASTVALKYESAIVLGADTTVVIDNQIIGKPEDLEDARRMLKILSGRWHEVLTGIAIIQRNVKLNEYVEPEVRIPKGKGVYFGWMDKKNDLEKTRVKFTEMSDEEINFLVQKGNPLDKAGAYAVQAQAALFIEKIEGDYWNVVGLPIQLVYNLLKNFLSK